MHVNQVCYIKSAMDGRTQQNTSGTDDARHDSGPRVCPDLVAMDTEAAIATRLLATAAAGSSSGLAAAQTSASAHMTVLADPDAASASTSTSTSTSTKADPNPAASRHGGSTANAAGRSYTPRPGSVVPTGHAVDADPDSKGPGRGPPHNLVTAEHGVHASATAEASQDYGSWWSQNSRWLIYAGAATGVALLVGLAVLARRRRAGHPWAGWHVGPNSKQSKPQRVPPLSKSFGIDSAEEQQKQQQYGARA